MLLLLIFVQISHASVVNQTLRMTQILFRHGDRSPIGSYPSDTHKESAWPQGFGQLSNVGIKQHYHLGQFFHRRYSQLPLNLISPSYKHAEVYVRSSDVDRALMSADANLAGLFVPPKDEAVATDIQWSPVPVHTVAIEVDNVLHSGPDICPAIQEIWGKHENSSEMKEIVQKYQSLFKFLEEKSQARVSRIKDVWNLYDTIFCEKEHNLTQPQWVDQIWEANRTVFDWMKEISDLSIASTYGLPETKYLLGGPLLSLMIKNMQDTGGPKLHIFSAHDTTVASLLAALNVYNNKMPPYTASVILELHGNVSERFVRIYFKNQTAGLAGKELLPLTMPGCSTDCPFSTFQKLVASSLPYDWRSQCDVASLHPYNQAWLIGAGIAVGIAFVLIIIAVITGLYCRRVSAIGYHSVDQV